MISHCENVDRQPIGMVDLKAVYSHRKEEFDAAMQRVASSGRYIEGEELSAFAAELSDFLKCRYVVPCANGTDALQIALMALDLKPGDEVIVPSFTYFATAEVVALLGLTPVFVDISPELYTMLPEKVEEAITPYTRALIVVHLFGQAAPMEPLLHIAKRYDLKLIEDNAQALGTLYQFSDGHTAYTGTIGDIGCQSFFPTKNLSCFGDGGAISLNDESLASAITQIAHHGQEKKYYHSRIGINSRLDALQAAILRVQLRYLKEELLYRKLVAERYYKAFQSIDAIILPLKAAYSDHTYHQFTVRVPERDALQQSLATQKIGSTVYYPLPIHKQKAFPAYNKLSLPNSEACAESVLSLPMHPFLTELQQNDIISAVKDFFL